MIIVSQGRDAIINFDNIDVLGTGKSLEDKEGKSKILANTISDEQCVIAEYKTEERAQEVLKEIINLYGKCELEKGEYAYKVYNAPKVYEMPKE